MNESKEAAVPLGQPSLLFIRYTCAMARTVVGVLRGGNSSEYDLSLKTGNTFLQSLPEDDFAVQDIFIDKQGLWHMRGVPTDPIRTVRQADVVINALHGGMGEDGTVQKILKNAQVRFTGSDALSAALTLNKPRSHDVLREAGIRLPHSVVLYSNLEASPADLARATFERIGPPYVLKPVSEGASQGVRVAHSVLELADALKRMLTWFETVIVEEFIHGKEVSVGVVENFRDEPLYAFPATEIVLPRGETFLTTNAYRDMSFKALAPAPSLSLERKKEVESIARRAHEALGLSHYSRADFIVTPKQIYLLEVNALPALYPGTPLYASMDAVGLKTDDFSKHILELAAR